MATITISLTPAIARQLDEETLIQGFATRSEFIRAVLRRYFARELELEPFVPRPLEEIKFELAKTGKYNQKFIESVSRGLAKSSPYVHLSKKARLGQKVSKTSKIILPKSPSPLSPH